MSEINKFIMDGFPGSDEVPAVTTRVNALALLSRTLEASRAAVDEITEAAKKTLSLEEQLRLSGISEQIANLAIEFTSNNS